MEDATVPCHVLIVEDQPLIAMQLEEAVEALGHVSVGIARNVDEAMRLGRDAEVAFIDVNLDDGPTGPLIGRDLAASDIDVLFMTSDVDALMQGVPGTLGVIEKPMMDLELVQAIQYAIGCRTGEAIAAPRKLIAFHS